MIFHDSAAQKKENGKNKTGLKIHFNCYSNDWTAADFD